MDSGEIIDICEKIYIFCLIPEVDVLTMFYMK